MSDPSSEHKTLSLQQALDLAMPYHTAGDLSKAESIYQQILQVDPNQPVALHLLGVISYQAGKNDLAVDLFKQALTNKPDYAEAHYNLGITLQQLGRLEEALASYHEAINSKTNYVEAHNNLGIAFQDLGRLDEAVVSYHKALAIKPNYAEAHYNLGNSLQELGKYGKAVTNYRKALSRKPNYAEAYINLGNALQKLGKLEEAVANYRKALAIKPDYAEAHYNFGNTLQELGRLEEALASFYKALSIKPDYAEAHNNLGTALKELGQLDEAVLSYHKALTIKPDDAEIHNNLGIALRDLGKQEDAFKNHQRAVALDPQNDSFWRAMAETLEGISFTSVDDNLLQYFWDLLDKSSVSPSGLTRPIVSALRHHPDILQIIDLVRSEKIKIRVSYRDIAERLSEIPLLLRIMALSPIYDLVIERVLTYLRQAMLQEEGVKKVGKRSPAFSSALALHCFVNEYIFQETKEETAAVKRLSEQIASLVKSGKEFPPVLLVALAAYKPLYRFPWAKDLLERDWPVEIKTLIAQQLKEPLEEIYLRDQIPSLSIIRNTVSEAVRDQYEENPYPRWVKGGLPAKAQTIGGFLRAPPLRLDLGEYITPENPQILVAGCGTGQHALATASRYSNARVLAVDLSLSSLSYAIRKTNELGFSNIEYAQADILELGNLGRQFDLVECGGVLHHLDDPLSGWRILVDLLRPGGLMRIGLYSEMARRYVAQGRSLIAMRGYTPSLEDIRLCRQDIIAMGEGGNREMSTLSDNIDFFNLSNCRDLLFHVQEHKFTLPQIGEYLRVLNLQFLGFEMRNQRAFRKFRKCYPSKQALTSLSLWHKFELQNPETFRAMYGFWCKKT